MNEITSVTNYPQVVNNYKKNKVVNFRAKAPLTAEDRFEKEKKKADRQRKTMTALQVGSLIAMIGMAGVVIWTSLRKGGEALDYSKIIWENLTKDKSLPDLKTAKSIDEGVRKRMMEIVDGANMPEAIRKKLGLEVPPNTMTLLGDAGVGKTYITRVVAKELNAKYTIVKFGDITSKYQGEASANMKKLMECTDKMAAKEPKQNFVLVLDEADPIMKNLGDMGENNDYLTQIRVELLKGIENLKKRKNVKIFITTNQTAEKLDNAVISRMGVTYTIPQPNEEVLLESLKFQLKKTAEALKVKDFDFYKDQEKEIAEFIKKVKEQGGAHRDIEEIVKIALTKCGQDAVKNKTPIADIRFDAKYLIEALEEKGQMAGEISKRRDAINSNFMNVLKQIQNQ